MLIRPAGVQDAEGCAEIYRPFVTGTVISFEETAPAAAQMAGRISTTTQTHPWLVAEMDGDVVGYAYATRHRARAAYRWGADVSVYVAPRARRQGLGQALYTELFAVLRRQHLRAAYAGVTLPNPPSVGLHEALGFRPVGVYRSVGFKFGAWHDVGWWQLRLGTDDGSTPEEPVPYGRLSG